MIKSLHFLSYPHKTWLRYLTHDVIKITKFHEDRTKDVDFLLMVIFLTCLVFFLQTLLYQNGGTLSEDKVGTLIVTFKRDNEHYRN